ncbi:MAG: AI-2E family transporter [Actinomycetales bacterium]
MRMRRRHEDADRESSQEAGAAAEDAVAPATPEQLGLEPGSAHADPADVADHVVRAQRPGSPRRPFDGIEIPYGVRLSAAWSWRSIVIAAGVALLFFVLTSLTVVVIPVVVALLLAALGAPAAARLRSWGVHRGPAALLVIVLGIAIVGGIVAFVTHQVVVGFNDLATQVQTSIDQLQSFLTRFGLSQDQLQQAVTQLRQEFIGGNGHSGLTKGVLSATVTAGHVLAGVFIMLFTLFFFLYDGRNIWLWLVRLLPAAARERTDGAGRRAWLVLESYTRATAIVALVDALGIGFVALLLGLPLVAPITALVFLGSFVPIVGATVSGAVAIAVALVAKGPLAALLMLLGVLAVQQLEAHVLQPFLLGRLVSVHPLAVILAIGVGSFLAGIVGALLAVPIISVANAVGHYLSSTSVHRQAAETAEATDAGDAERAGA